MTTFAVDPASLSALASTLSTLGGEMQAMKPAAGGFQGLLGGRSLEDAVDSFAGGWQYGIELLDQHMKNVVENLQRAAADYQQSDQYVADACAAPSGGR
jgi:hypothetical protein